MSKILITGATGFLGKNFYKSSEFEKYQIHVSTRFDNQINLKNIENFNIGDINSKTRWSDALNKVDYIIHCAARTHIMNEVEKEELTKYRQVNVEGTINLAKQAAAKGVKRLIFLSSIKVNGDKTIGSSSFKYNDIVHPKDPYAISKLEAEQALREISKDTELEIVIIRAPLVYGKGVKGNLSRLIKLIKYGLPLPLGLIQNQRSMIGVDNLIDLISCCIENPDAAGKTFLASDGKDLSTPDLINHIASSMKRIVRLFPFPIFLLKFFGKISGKKKEINRLVGSLKIDSSYTQKVLNWKPPVSVEEGIKRMVQDS
jgi:nucleoside-diphosphate-sugar epimerase